MYKIMSKDLVFSHNNTIVSFWYLEQTDRQLELIQREND